MDNYYTGIRRSKVMWEQGSSTHSVCVCVCVCVYYRFSERYDFSKAKVRYQQKALTVWNKSINLGIELKLLSLRVMTVISFP